MPNTLTLATTSYYSGKYDMNDSTVFSAVTTPGGGAVNFNFSDTVTIAGTGVNATGLDMKSGNDSLVVNTTLTGNPTGPSANSFIGLGAGNDIASFNGAVTDYSLQAGVGNDTLAINAAVKNTIISGAAGADAIFINANIIGGQIAATGAVAGGPTSTQINDGNDTITIAAGVTGTGTLINQFSKLNDTLIIGGTTITGINNLNAGTYTASQYLAAAGNDALYNWLANGSNRITLI